MFLWSSTPVIAALGLGKTSLLKFLAITGLGNVATSSVYVFFAHKFSGYLAPVNSWVSDHGTYVTIALGCAVAVSGSIALRRARVTTHGPG